MTKSELIQRLMKRKTALSIKDIDLSVKYLCEYMAQTLADGERIEVRGFGCFTLHHRKPRQARNPKTGDLFSLSSRYLPHFKPGKMLKEAVNKTR
jgi:integration host factor subunit beta